VLDGRGGGGGEENYSNNRAAITYNVKKVVRSHNIFTSSDILKTRYNFKRRKRLYGDLISLSTTKFIS
jgi:hypothetical protein